MGYVFRRPPKDYSFLMLLSILGLLAIVMAVIIIYLI